VARGGATITTSAPVGLPGQTYSPIMLAIGHFYSSPAFLGWAGILVAIVTLAVIAAQFASGSSKRALVYSLVSDTALLSEGAREKAGPGLHVTLGEDALDDPHVVSLRIECKGRRDIRSADFEDGKPLMFHVGTPILKQLDRQADADAMPGISFDSGAQAIGIGPGLIKKGQLISIDLLTDGQASLRCISPLADVAIRESQADGESDLVWAKRLQGAAFTLFGVGLFGWFVSYQTPFYFVLAVFLCGTLGFTVWIARAARSARRSHGRFKVANIPQTCDSVTSAKDSI
jgi:hypothetical protein